jgi:tetratricopeptide (TPR) repeat protein
VDYRLMPTLASENLSLVTLGAEAGLNYALLPRVSLEASLLVGGYLGLFGEEPPAVNPFATLGAGARFRLSPAFSLGAGLSYAYYLTRDISGLQALWNGLSVSLAGGVRLTGGSPRPLLRFDPVEIQPIFPVFYKYYDRNPLGKVVVRNLENGTIQNVRVSFMVGEFMQSPKECLVIPSLKARQSMEVPIYALFRDDILRVTEATSVSGEITAEYMFAGELRNVSQTQTVRVYDRNAMSWDDDRKAASFVTPRDTTVMTFAKGVVGDLRDRGATVIDPNLRNAMALFAGMWLYGLNYVVDPKSSYAEFSKNNSAVDYLQFPRQTLEYRAGDCDDLAILYAALLESIGISAAFVTVPGHIYLAFALNMTDTEAQKTFARMDDLIVRDQAAWVPVEVTLLQAGFLKAWEAGARQWRENQPAAGFYPVAEAWKTYEAVGIEKTEEGRSLKISLPSSTRLASVYDGQLKDFIEREVAPQEAELKKRIAATKQNAALINRLGLLYARYGKYDQATAELEKLVGKSPFVPALVNLGNIYFLKGDHARALNYYSQAARTQPTDAGILISLARAQFGLQRYEEARASYRKAESLDAGLANRFSYIVAENVSSARASAQDSKGVLLWNDPD